MTEHTASGRGESPDRTAAALELAALGHSVFPCWGVKDGSCRCPKGAGCTSPGKHPATGSGFHDATTDPDRIRTFLSGHNNYGVVPNGEDTFILDVDGDDVERLLAMEERLGPLPDTLRTVTANGVHLWFRWPAGVPKPAHRLFGVVTRWSGATGHGGYVIGPGSEHVTGFIYDFINGQREVAELPPRWVQEAGVKPVEFVIPGGPDELPGPGGRHEWLRNRARYFAGFIRDPRTLEAAVMAENARLSSPKTEEEVRRAIGDVLEKFGPDPDKKYEGHLPFRQVGMGYEATIDKATLSIDRLSEARGQVYGELRVSIEGKHVTQLRVTLMDPMSRQKVADILDGLAPLGVVWFAILEAFFQRVLEEERRVPPLADIGFDPIRPEPEYVLKPLAIKGKGSILFAAEGMGKSTLSAAIAVSVASGTPVLPSWVVPEARNVLVLDWEADREDWNDLVAGIAAGMDVPNPAGIKYQRMSQSLHDAAHFVSQLVDDYDIGLIIVDSVMMASAGGNTDLSESARILFKTLRTFGVAAVLIDHVAKATEPGKAGRPFGSVFKPALARSTWELTVDENRHPEWRDTGYIPDGPKHLVLCHRKANLTGYFPDTHFCIAREGGKVTFVEQAGWLGTTGPTIAVKREQSKSYSDAVAALSGHTMTYAQWTIASGVSANTLRELVRDHRDDFVDLSTATSGKSVWGLAAEHRQLEVTDALEA